MTDRVTERSRQDPDTVIRRGEDAAGQRWTSIGAPMKGEATRWMADWMSPAELAAMKAMNVSDWNTNDIFGHSWINFDGWRYVSFPLPGQYPGEGYHWPMNGQWRWNKDGIVHYPLKFTRLILELPEKTLHVKTYAPVKRAEIYVKDLTVGYGDAEHFKAAGGPAFSLDPLLLASAELAPSDVLAWAKPLLANGPVLVYSTSEPGARAAARRCTSPSATAAR